MASRVLGRAVGHRRILAAQGRALYFAALTASVELAQEKGKHPSFDETRAARGELQFDAWGVKPEDTARWDALRARIREVGLRNSLLIAIAPTAISAAGSLAGWLSDPVKWCHWVQCHSATSVPSGMKAAAKN